MRILSLPAFIRDVIGDLVNLDARIWRSLGTLAFKPGQLTRLYIEGQRARYTPPFRMYVVMSLAFFLAFSLLRFETAPPVGAAAAASTDASVDAASDTAIDNAGVTREPDDAAAAEAVAPDAAIEEEGLFNVTLTTTEVGNAGSMRA